MKEALELIEFIAHDYIELSHDKIEWQRNDHVKRCRKFLDDPNNTYWKTMESAPKDRPILAICEHDFDQCSDESSEKLSIYLSHCEGLSNVEDGIHVIEFGGEYSEYDWESGVNFKIPDWWFLNGSEFTVVANPIAWMPIPELDIEI